MIHYVEGDIHLTGAAVIAHGLAAMDPMTKGLAKTLHEQYPAMHKDFHHWCRTQHPKPGDIWMWGGAGGRRIVCMITQEGGYGHGARPGQATVAHVSHALRALTKMAAAEGFTSIALPRVATGVGGLDWDMVRPVVEERLGSLPIPIYVYSTFHAGQAADEPS